jgi:uncharacterized protein YbaA (DUF1428 family)
MARYVDGYVLPLPKRNVAAYRKMAKLASKVWKDHGALEYRECVGEDFNTPCGVSFSKLAKCRKGETVVFAYIVYRSRAERDRVNAKVMTDPRLAKMMNTKPPFDMTRMSFSGFETLVEA